jgi:hypothetical protein
LGSGVVVLKPPPLFSFKENKMPLVENNKSAAALNQNIATEIKAGKPLKQACAIAYSVREKAKKNTNFTHKDY